MSRHDEVDHPQHYTNHPSGVECIEIAEHFTFCVGNAVKYLWRAGLKGDEITDLHKARWYIEREITRRQHAQSNVSSRTSARVEILAALDPDGMTLGELIGTLRELRPNQIKSDLAVLLSSGDVVLSAERSIDNEPIYRCAP